MLSENQLEALLRVFETRMQTVVDEYLTEMGEHLKAIGQLLPSDVNRLTELKRVNANVDHIKRVIAKAAERSVEDIEKVFVAVAAAAYDFMSKYYGEARQLPILENKAILRILQAQANVTAQAMKNLSQTTILSEGYRKAVDVAVQTVQAGVVDYNTAIRTALKAAAQEGLRVYYPNSGLTRRLDTAVRMNVLDGVRALNNDVLWQTGEEFGADAVELSAHALCAEDHLPYQGKQYSMEEFDALQNRLKRPIGMWNCKHTRHPIILGVSEPAHSPEQLEQLRRNSSQQITIDGDTKTRYEWTQEQRRIETAIRQQDDILTMAKAAGDSVSKIEAERNIRELIRRYDDVSEKAGLELRYDRTVGHAVYKPNATKSLKNAGTGGIINIGAPIKTVGAASPNTPNVKNLETGMPLDFVQGRRPVYPPDHTMAGYGCKTGRKIDEVDELAEFYNTPDAEKWQKEKARYWVYDQYGEERLVELHWYQHPDVGKVEHKIKTKGGRMYVDEWDD